MIKGNPEHIRISDRKKATLFSGLSSLLSSGLDFSRAFLLLTDSGQDRKVKSLLTALYTSVVNGGTLWESFRNSGSFTALDAGVLRIGEETGRIGESLQFLSDYYDRRISQRKMITGALSYPLIVMVTALLVLVFMMLVIVPMFEQVYARMGGELPGITRSIIAFSRAFPALLLWLGSGSFLLGGIVWRYRKSPVVRSASARLLLRLPGIGPLIRKNQEARFCKLLYLLYGSGVPLLQGIEMLKDIITFYPYQQSFISVGRALRQGELLAAGLASFAPLYNRKLLTLLRVGEETNRLAPMLLHEGDELTRELEHELKQVGNFLEPVLILGVGGLVALVLIAMYMPMFKLGGVMG